MVVPSCERLHSRSVAADDSSRILSDAPHSAVDGGARLGLRTIGKLDSKGFPMATPKGMRAQQFPINNTDAVHVYSDETHIWLQLRREVPTESDIGRSSFKIAICLQPGTAHKLGLELINMADKNREKLKSKAKAVAR